MSHPSKTARIAVSFLLGSSLAVSAVGTAVAVVPSEGKAVSTKNLAAEKSKPKNKKKYDSATGKIEGDVKVGETLTMKASFKPKVGKVTYRWTNGHGQTIGRQKTLKLTKSIMKDSIIGSACAHTEGYFDEEVSDMVNMTIDWDMINDMMAKMPKFDEKEIEKLTKQLEDMPTAEFVCPK